jgi:TolA-binding protein
MSYIDDLIARAVNSNIPLEQVQRFAEENGRIIDDGNVVPIPEENQENYIPVVTQLHDQIETLQEKNESLENLIAQTSSDLSAFMDFFFEMNPYLA